GVETLDDDHALRHTARAHDRCNPVRDLHQFRPASGPYLDDRHAASERRRPAAPRAHPAPARASDVAGRVEADVRAPLHRADDEAAAVPASSRFLPRRRGVAAESTPPLPWAPVLVSPASREEPVSPAHSPPSIAQYAVHRLALPWV